MPSAFLLKIAVGLTLFFIHIQTYGIDELSHDGETFFKEGRLLYNVFFESPIHYFQLLTGIGESDALIHKYLYMTEYWSAGDLSLINDSKNVIRAHSLIHFVSGNSVFIHLAIFCMISLAAVRNLYLSVKPYIAQKNSIVFWILLLVPSTIFWTSSLMKEPFMFFGFTLFLRALVYEKILWKKILFTMISSSLLLAFKPYVLACILLSLICFGIYKFIFKRKVLISLFGIGVLVALFILVFQKPRDKVVHYLTRKQFDFVNVGKGGLHALSDTSFFYFQPHQYSNLEMKDNKVRLIKETDAYLIHFGSTQKPKPIHLKPNGEFWTIAYFAPGCTSYIETTPINDSYLQLIKNIPESLINASIRPFPNDPGSKLKFLSFVEVWILFAFLAFAIIKRRTLNSREKELLFVLFFFWFFLTLLIGWTTPVLGAISRYRFPAQLALVISSLIIIKPFINLKWKNTSS